MMRDTCLLNTDFLIDSAELLIIYGAAQRARGILIAVLEKDLRNARAVKALGDYFVLSEQHQQAERCFQTYKSLVEP